MEYQLTTHEQVEEGWGGGIRTRSTEVRDWRHLRKNFWKVWMCGEEKEEEAEAGMTRGVEWGAGTWRAWGGFCGGDVRYRVIT